MLYWRRLFAKHLASLVKNNLNLPDADPAIHNLYYVFLPLYDTFYLFTNFSYSLKEIMFDYSFGVRPKFVFVF